MIATRIYRCSKNGPRDFQIYEKYVFYQVRKMVTGLQRKWWFLKPLKKAYTSDRFWSLIFQIVSFCKTSILIATQKMHHVPANINVFEIQRKAKYHPCSLKFNLPICAVRKICASLPEFENFTESDLLSNTKNVPGLQRKWCFSKSLKKAYTSDNFWSLSFQSLVL